MKSRSEDYNDIKASVDIFAKKEQGIADRSLKNVIELQPENIEENETSSDETSDLYLM